MPDRESFIVVNTTPLIALSAAFGDLSILKDIYSRVAVPRQVQDELRAAGDNYFAFVEFKRASGWLDCPSESVTIADYLGKTLDTGEAAVIQTAVNEKIPLVCIDEVVGRRVARLSGLTLTGSIGILIKAKQLGHSISIADAIQRVRERGVWLGNDVIEFAMRFA
jgi:predicted nucleic acid-binding protein